MRPGGNTAKIVAYKLFRVRKDGTLGSLFINRRAVIPVGRWMRAKQHMTRGFALRSGWHTLPRPIAPHLSKKGRVWYAVEINYWRGILRPTSQGGIWYIAQSMRVLHPVQEKT